MVSWFHIVVGVIFCGAVLLITGYFAAQVQKEREKEITDDEAEEEEEEKEKKKEVCS